ncbi:MAG: hypothetical protein ACKVXR_05655 [Planctomycetota bacterium]
MAEWKFARRRDRCNTCGSPFEEGTRHVSALSLASEELSREDLCLACWEKSARAGEIFFWYTRMCAERRGLRLDLPMLEALFHRLEGRTEEGMIELRYVLCLLLMRKKRLKLVRITRDPAETMSVRRPRRDELLPVLVRDLTAERIEELRGELAEIFDGAEAAPAGSEGGGLPEELPPPRPREPVHASPGVQP